MIRRLLIANRGEIAVRIARTAHRMGIETVGVYSDVDVSALHVDVVDRAVRLEGRTPAETYLRADLVLTAAVDHECDAVHPGYGFLSENASFARAVLDAGLVWVGPTHAQIELLGDKVAAKRAAVEAGVPTTPAIEITADDPPAGVPLPALVKAAAGGGGRGMRVVREGDDVVAAVAAASREAEAAFGDGTVFIEPYLERGRHVEVQILGDRHGNVVHLGERECSIQRRNQKIVEEAPSAGITAEVRSILCDGALALARHVDYENAGTVEFMVGDDGTITFLEVNTRLQVEHPVTEAVTGLDLVELQLRVAAGEPLPIGQDDVHVDGHAIEVRVVAEDPAAGWIPSTGTIGTFRVGDGVRVDAGFRAGSEISSEYDSLLAKVIAHAPTREEAAARLGRALRTSTITGVRTDVASLAALLVEPDYLGADTPTSYLAEHSEVEQASGPQGDARVAQLVAAVLVHQRAARADDAVLGFAPSHFRNLRTHGQRSVWIDEATGAEVSVEVCSTGDGHEVRVGAWPQPGDDGALGSDQRAVHVVRETIAPAGHVAVEIDGVRRSTRVDVDTGLEGDVRAVHVTGADGQTSWSLAPRFVDHDASAAGAGPVSPLPGSVLSVHVGVGDRVTDGQLLVVVEAMKMEHQITAPSDGVVTAVRVEVGDRVDTGDLLVEVDAGDGTEG